MVLDDRRDVTEALGARRALRSTGGGLEHDLGEVLRSLDRLDVLDADALGGRVEEAARARRRRLEEGQRRHPQGVAGGADDLVERHALCVEVRGVDLHLELLVALTPRR